MTLLTAVLEGRCSMITMVRAFIFSASNLGASSSPRVELVEMDGSIGHPETGGESWRLP